MNRILLLFLLFLTFSCGKRQKQEESRNLEKENIVTDYWQKKPFIKVDSINPILRPDPKTIFLCPVSQNNVRWEEKDVFNPAAIVKEGKIYMLYRAEDAVGKYMGTSRIGLAVSQDGMHFIKNKLPVFYPDNDDMKIFEWEGGCEDPRIVQTDEGWYIMTYTSYDGNIARLCLASSYDLENWTKQGLVFGQAFDGKYKDLWSKSGAIVCKVEGNDLIATAINGRYWMYWGDTNIYLAASEDLIHWTPVENTDGSLKIVFGPRKGYFDSHLVEPGPPAILTTDGIWMIYNSRNHAEWGDTSIPEGTYAAGQILFDRSDPASVLARSEEYFFKPEHDYEITGQIGNVCFLEALVPFKGKWFLYYGTADSKIAVAVYENNIISQ
jgi:predicted GH43/DUF377 family glycosyl hydrolase